MNTEEISKKILITGGLGYIGSHTIVELLSQEFLDLSNIKHRYEIVIIDNCSNSSELILSKLEEITKTIGKIKYINVDILDIEKLESVFQNDNFYAIIHFAGKKSVFESTQNPLLYYKNNVGGSINLIDMCIKYKVENFIFSSSCCVYGNRDNNCTEEETILKPINSYGNTKLQVEQILIDVSKSNTNFKSVILRYCNPVAAHKSGIIGENPIGVPANLFPVIERHVRGITDKMFVFGNDYNTSDGTPIRDYVHVTDIARGHVLALQAFNTENLIHLFNENCAIYNMGTNSGYSVFEVINTYMEINPGVIINYEVKGRRFGDAEKSVPNSDKIAKDLGWKPTTTLKEMCKDSYNFICKNPNGI